MKTKLDLSTVKNEVEREIIQLIHEKEQCMMGDIIMHLKLSYQRGKAYISSLESKNVVTNRDKAPFYTLNVDLS
ncbi:hypothetical protein [Mangrovibacterium diazotrophicum]|uniref:Uncharacterized protein n=1 Tax=Mangrovibacterium diazotrophicum TaxID=1261403 RepID=A0A419W8B9_9BACT|nr:hypothetical protein [Mangrovibacterium diazotrophicum]RKD91698.1 hypothetical protein BC643_2061 [Mangrovibacterium diazotrophicum]